MGADTRSERERIYDKQIAPLLAQAGKIAEEHGMPIVAQVEYEPGDFGLTAYIPLGASYVQRMTYWAARAKANIDVFMMAVMRHAEEHGHSSMYLAILFRALRGTDMVRPSSTKGDPDVR